jgi:hypothetical protein
MRRRLAVLILTTSLLGVLLAPLPGGAAQAAAIPGVLPQLLPPRLLTEVGKPVPPAPVFRSGFSLSRPHGYEVRVFTFGSAVILEVLHGGQGHFSATAYLARGVAAPHRLQATFGKFGKISMRFRPPRKGSGVKSVCRFGDRLTQRHGLYTGHFTFRGEGNYLSLDLHRAKGSIVIPAGHCRRRHHLTQAEAERELEALFEPATGLLASSREGVATTSFLGFQRRDRAVFLASREETHGRLAIIRFAFAVGSKGLHANEAVTAASISPPAPFHATARYRAAPDGTTTWTGPLSVNFPGAPRFPLTGPNFEVFLEVPF